MDYAQYNSKLSLQVDNMKKKSTPGTPGLYEVYQGKRYSLDQLGELSMCTMDNDWKKVIFCLPNAEWLPEQLTYTPSKNKSRTLTVMKGSLRSEKNCPNAWFTTPTKLGIISSTVCRAACKEIHILPYWNETK
jgi:hypothetical protein